MRDQSYKNCHFYDKMLFSQIESGEDAYREVELLGLMRAHKLKDLIH